MKVPFVHSGYARKENDDYQTIDGRCLEALVASTPGILKSDHIVDFCASHGSGIVTKLNEMGFFASGAPNAFENIKCDWIVTNPPYDRKIVDSFVDHAISLLDSGSVRVGAAFLMRANWDFAVSRSRLFDNPRYAAQIKMRFRPWWTEKRDAQPIHNFVWHLWTAKSQTQRPVVLYWP